PSLEFRAPFFSHGLKVAMVGRYTEKKGLPDGLRACALARRQGVEVDITVIGDAHASDADGQRIKAELHAIAKNSELKGCVRFAGFLALDKMRAALREHNVFLCPSKRAADGDAEGGSPVVLTEAMALGLLCIGTRHCDIPELIRDGDTG